MKRIFLVDDYPDSCGKVKQAFLASNFDVIIFDSVQSILDQKSFDDCVGILADINMPEMTGDLLVKTLRGKINRPIPFCLMTAGDLEESLTHYYDFTVDEFFHKDASIIEIQKRFEAVLRRVQDRSNILEQGPIRVDLTLISASVNGVILNLTTTEFRIICQLILGLRLESYVNKKEFFAKIWGDTFVEEKTITTHLANLNKKLTPHNVKVKTKRFKGLYFDF